MHKLFLSVILGISLLFVSCLKQENPVSVPKDAESLTKITDGKYPSISMDGKKLAFSRNGAIFISDTNGRNTVQLTDGRFSDIMPQWSPDGRRIGFIRKQTPQSKYGLVMVADTITKLVIEISTTDSVYCQLEYSQQAYNIYGSPYVSSPFWSWSPDGNKIAFYTGNDTLTSLSIIQSDGSGASLGKYILYQSSNHEYSYWSNYSGFCWLPFSDQILCSSNVYGDTSRLYKINVGSDTMIRVSDKYGVSNPTCSSDGNVIGFASLDFPKYRLIDRQFETISIRYEVGFSPKLSPNGMKVISYYYFQDSNPDGQTISQLDCTDITTGRESFLVQSDWDYNFVFHPSSKWVFFSRGGEIFRVDL